MLQEDLVDYSIELARLVCLNEELHVKTIKAKANLQEFERSLFNIIVSNDCSGVIYNESVSMLRNKLNDTNFTDGIYSTIDEGIITFYDADSNPLLTYQINILDEDYNLNTY